MVTGLAQTNILLETGTNELELLEFSIAGNHFGINVAKVSELMQIQPVQAMPNSHPCVEGIFQPRAEVYTVVDLGKFLNLPDSTSPEKDIYVITTFNKTHLAFHVHAVDSIHRISWKSIEKPNTVIYGDGDGVVTGIAKVNGRIISILDFEKITFDICPATGIRLETVTASSAPEKHELPVLMAEDSPLLRKLILAALQKAGYTNTIITTNGEEAWRFLETAKEQGDDLKSHVALVVTDIEMPQMDGHRLTKLIKSDPVLKELPVVIFSSLIDDNTYKKGLEVGADAQLSKPEIANLVATLENLLYSQ